MRAYVGQPRCSTGEAKRGLALLDVLAAVVVLAVLAVSAMLCWQRAILHAKLALQGEHLALIIDHLEMYQAKEGIYPPGLHSLVKRTDGGRSDDGGFTPLDVLPHNPLGRWAYRPSDGQVWPVDYDPRSPHYLPPRRPGSGKLPPPRFPWAILGKALTIVAALITIYYKTPAVRALPWTLKRLSLRKVTTQAKVLAATGALTSLADLKAFIHLRRSEACLRSLKPSDRVSLVLAQLLATAPGSSVVIRIYREWQERYEALGGRP